MGSSVTSWDVVNEIIGDGVSNGMSALQCVQNKNVWPTQNNLVSDLSFVYAAFNNAYKYAGSGTHLAINDYNTGLSSPSPKPVTFLTALCRWQCCKDRLRPRGP